MFFKDLEFGKIYEKELLKIVPYDNFNSIDGLFKDYDIEIIKDDNKTLYEVKSDRLTQKTNNVCIEFECSNKPSGITTTKSDLYAYFIIKNNGYDLIVIKTDTIKKLIKEKKYNKIKSGGDNNKSIFYLFNKNIFYSNKEWDFSQTN
jgi:hypothetical protein